MYKVYMGRLLGYSCIGALAIQEIASNIDYEIQGRDISVRTGWALKYPEIPSCSLLRLSEFATLILYL